MQWLSFAATTGSLLRPAVSSQCSCGSPAVDALLDSVFYRGEVQLFGLAAETKDDVTGQLPVSDKRIGYCAGASADRVSHDGVTAFRCNDDADTASVRGDSIAHQSRGDYLFATANNASEVVCLDDPVASREHDESLDRKFGASLAAASCQNGASRASTHTQTEAVNFRTTAVVGLEGSLRHNYLLGVSPDA